jgi:hypothetical protein
MSGPIVRSGPSATFTKNWDSVFGGKKSAKKAPAAKKTAAPAKKKKKAGK